jgi:hypothetical protein
MLISSFVAGAITTVHPHAMNFLLAAKPVNDAERGT